MHDFGIIGQTMPQYDPSRCVSCQACIKGCKSLSVNVLKMENYKIVRDADKCVGCGVCVTKCPTRAWTRSEKKYYKLSIMGRTGKKNPRLGEDFLVIDRVGFELFKEYALKDVTLMPETKVHNNVYWSGIHFDHNNMN